MIYRKVEPINEKLINEARMYNFRNPERVERSINHWVGRHQNTEDWYVNNVINKNQGQNNEISPSVKQERMKSLEDLVKLYYYLVETKSNDPKYSAYIETMDSMIWKGGLITIPTASLPMQQMISQSMEYLTVDTIKLVNNKENISIAEKEWGKQDKGVDVVWDNANIDVKTTKHNDLLNPNSNLGTIKNYALNDNTKKTDYILWTSNMIEQGYICLIGLEKWSDIKKDISNQENNWNKFENTKFNLVMHNKHIKHFVCPKYSDFDKSNIFSEKYIGMTQQEIETAKRKLGNLREKNLSDEKLCLITEKIVSKPVQNLSNKDINTINKTFNELARRFKRESNNSKVREAGVLLSKYKIEIQNHYKNNLSRYENVR